MEKTIVLGTVTVTIVTVDAGVGERQSEREGTRKHTHPK